MRFRNKVCVVTGGNSGIGKATCIQFAKEGATVVILDLNRKQGSALEKIIKDLNAEVLFIKTDVSKMAELKKAVKAITGKYKKIDVLVNNAAIMSFKPLNHLKENEWNRLMNTNLTAAFLLSKYCLPFMKNGSIINISSVHAHETSPNVIPYSVSKAGLEALTRGMSQEYSPGKIRVNCVAPGAIDTPMLWSNPNIKSGKEKLKGKIGKPEDIANAVCFLASDEANYINGTTLVVDNGKLNVL